MSASVNGPKVAFLWGNPQGDQPSGILVKLPAGFIGMMRGHGSTFRAVVIQGRPAHRAAGGTEVTTMELGSYLSSKGESVHQVSCKAGEECILYVRMQGTSGSTCRSCQPGERSARWRGLTRSPKACA